MKLPATQGAAGRHDGPDGSTRHKPSDALRWRQAGYRPTRNPDAIRRLGNVPGADIAIALNVPGPDGPMHPARLCVVGGRVTGVSCVGLGRHHSVAHRASEARTAALEAVEVARGWLCSWAVIDDDGGVL